MPVEDLKLEGPRPTSEIYGTYNMEAVSGRSGAGAFFLRVARTRVDDTGTNLD